MLRRNKHKFGHCAHRTLCKESNYFNCWKLPICNEQRDGKDCRKGPGDDEQESQAPPAYYHSKIIALSFMTNLWSNPTPPNQRVQVQELWHPRVHIRMCTASLFSFSKVATMHNAPTVNQDAPVVKIVPVFQVREDLNRKKTFSFGHCPNEGGVYPCPNFWPFFQEVHFWSIKRVDFFKNANVLNF